MSISPGSMDAAGFLFLVVRDVPFFHSGLEPESSHRVSTR
ncbi:hypothetical protein AGR7A_Lc20021 [Agrobacterium deltaense NCPPB 1641]|uniref:Uncharacterized protein n=1 Tax=Agrobacterium deltaense NCPPB 1641 TaxID=1183425 RepID=A0A1S7U496_9HYPH|nr:hypothetical protein AGR7A_Lc20021 [Agrobacterium deltaense NCPPB 1641]